MPIVAGTALYSRMGNITPQFELDGQVFWDLDYREQHNLSDTELIPQELFTWCLLKVVNLAERVAHQGRFDFVRVDIFLKDYCDELYVNELSFFPSQKAPIETVRKIAERWRYGCGIG